MEAGGSPKGPHIHASGDEGSCVISNTPCSPGSQTVHALSDEHPLHFVSHVADFAQFNLQNGDVI